MSYFKYYFDTSDLRLSLGAEKLLNIFRDRYELSAKKGFTGKNGNVVFLRHKTIKKYIKIYSFLNYA